MRYRVAKTKLVEWARNRPPGYADELAPAIVDGDADSVVYDTQHPAYQAALRKYLPARMRARTARRPQPPTLISGSRTTFDPVAAAEAQRRFAICKACEHSRDDGFACALHTGCCFGRWRAMPDSKCPKGKWEIDHG